MKITKSHILFLLIITLHSCSVEKFIPEDELLYTGGEVEIDTASNFENTKEIKEQLENVLRPKPNNTILGMRPGLYFYYKAQRENPGFINKFLNDKLGEEPVYASDVELPSTEELLLNRAENSGFFNTGVDSEMIENIEEKTAKASYTVTLPEPYTLENYNVVPVDSLPIYNKIEESLSQTLIAPGMRFDLSTLKAERERIDNTLKNIGYYNFQPNALIFEADTNQYDQRKFDLYLRLKENMPKEAYVPYVIETINVYPNYSLETDSAFQDVVRYDDMNFIQEEVYFKPKKLAPYILLEEGKKYNSETSAYTGRRLSNIGSYEYVNIRYDQKDSISGTDSIAGLVANIYLSPVKRRSLRAELQGVTKSSGFAGPGLAVTYSNRNLFKGGEMLNITGRLSYEAQISGKDRRGQTSTEFGLQTDLIIPRLLFPISVDNNWFRYSIPKTKISLGGNYLSRSQLYSLGSVFASFGYIWNANAFVTHELNPVEVNYVSLTKTTPEFEQILDENPFLRQSFNQEFIAGITYSYTYNEMGANKTHQFFLNSNLDLAGNILNMFGSEQPDGAKTVFGLQYAQYAKADMDFRYHFNVGSGQTIAARLFGGIGLPYGNSEFMPYSKQFYSGGPYSVRAFNIRSLGPGTYTPDDEGSTAAFFDRTGNIRLEANVEYRFPIISFLKGAVFADAGNIWNTQEIENMNGGKFSSNFLNELGIGIGTGLRVDIQNFVIRFDLAFPMHDPSLPQGERWTYDFGSPVFNFAIGYPF